MRLITKGAGRKPAVTPAARKFVAKASSMKTAAKRSIKKATAKAVRAKSTSARSIRKTAAKPLVTASVNAKLGGFAREAKHDVEVAIDGMRDVVHRAADAARKQMDKAAQTASGVGRMLTHRSDR